MSISTRKPGDCSSGKQPGKAELAELLRKLWELSHCELAAAQAPDIAEVARYSVALRASYFAARAVALQRGTRVREENGGTLFCAPLDAVPDVRLVEDGELVRLLPATRDLDWSGRDMGRRMIAAADRIVAAAYRWARENDPHLTPHIVWNRPPGKGRRVGVEAV